MSANKVAAIIYKQMIDISRNMVVIFLIGLYPILTFIFYFILNGNPTIEFILPSFITLNIVMAPIIVMSNVISEEKEKGTLRVLVMSNVKPMDYLAGIGITVFVIILISLMPYILILKFSMASALLYILHCVAAVLISSIIGAIIGIAIKNQMGVGAISSPVSMVFGMIPLLTNLNKNIGNFSKYLYSQQVYNFVASPTDAKLTSGFLIIGINLIIAITVFLVLYKRKGIE